MLPGAAALDPLDLGDDEVIVLRDEFKFGEFLAEPGERKEFCDANTSPLTLMGRPLASEKDVIMDEE